MHPNHEFSLSSLLSQQSNCFLALTKAPHYRNRCQFSTNCYSLPLIGCNINNNNSYNNNSYNSSWGSKIMSLASSGSPRLSPTNMQQLRVDFAILIGFTMDKSATKKSVQSSGEGVQSRNVAGQANEQFLQPLGWAQLT